LSEEMEGEDDGVAILAEEADADANSTTDTSLEIDARANNQK